MGGRRGTSATYSQLQTDTVTMSPPNVPPLCNPISTYILGIFVHYKLGHGHQFIGQFLSIDKIPVFILQKIK